MTQPDSDAMWTERGARWDIVRSFREGSFVKFHMGYNAKTKHHRPERAERAAREMLRPGRDVVATLDLPGRLFFLKQEFVAFYVTAVSPLLSRLGCGVDLEFCAPRLSPRRRHVWRGLFGF